MPIFVQVHHRWRKYYLGGCEVPGLRTNFEMVHLKRVPKQFYHLNGLLDLFKTKLVRNTYAVINKASFFDSARQYCTCSILLTQLCARQSLVTAQAGLYPLVNFAPWFCPLNSSKKTESCCSVKDPDYQIIFRVPGLTSTGIVLYG
jgi:hypothetical protein